jgi:predicted Ser/Thr protein kinase
VRSLLAALLLGLGASALAAPADDPVEAKQLEAPPLMGELSAAMQQLEELRPAYTDPGRFLQVEQERARILPRVVELSRKLERVLDEHQNLRTRQETLSTLTGLLSVRAKGDAPKMDARAFTRLNSRTQFEADVHAVTDHVMPLLKADKSAYEAGYEAYSERRLRMQALSALGVILTLAVGAALWKHRARLSLIYRSRYALVPGVVLNGGYRIDRELGGGALGVVYEATDLGLQRKVAIKRLRDDLAFDDAELAKLLAEARAAAGLKHPNIVETYSAFEERGQAFFVLEFVSGKNLDELLPEGKSAPLLWAKGVLRQAAAALDYAHAQGMLHRGLKPSNILITPEGFVKVSDFGIAYQARASALRLSRGPFSGAGRKDSPYSAPELKDGKAVRESDVYSLAATLHRVLVGRPPSPTSMPVPAPVDGILLKALSAAPAERFRTPGEFAAALEAVPV